MPPSGWTVIVGASRTVRVIAELVAMPQSFIAMSV